MPEVLGRYPKASSQEADGIVGSSHITRPRQPISNEDAAGGHDEYAGDAQQRGPPPSRLALGCAVTRCSRSDRAVVRRRYCRHLRAAADAVKAQAPMAPVLVAPVQGPTAAMTRVDSLSHAVRPTARGCLAAKPAGTRAPR